MQSRIVLEKMTELAAGEFTYKDSKDALPEHISEVYDSSPLYFGLMGRAIGTNSVLQSAGKAQKGSNLEEKIYLVIYRHGKPAALLMCALHSPAKGKASLGWILVHRKYLFQSIGRQNYLIFSEAMKSIGINQIRILIEPQNEKAAKFWTGLGFKKTPCSAEQGDGCVCGAAEYFLSLA